MTLDRVRTWLRKNLAVWMYGLLFRLLTVAVPEAEELDQMLEMLDGDRE